MDELTARDLHHQSNSEYAAISRDAQSEVQSSERNNPIVRATAVVSRASAPFVWQCDRRLLLLDEEAQGWILAELEFDPAVCRYQELRRANYRWEREAVGALLSRALAGGDGAADESAELLDGWLDRHHGRSN